MRGFLRDAGSLTRASNSQKIFCFFFQKSSAFFLLRRDRRGGIALMFAILALPMAAMLGLAIDYARLDQTQGALYLAANSAALNAVKVAATGQVNNDANYVSEAQAAGAAWSGAQLGTAASQVSGLQTQVTVTPGATITVAVTLSGRTTPLFGRLFGISGYNVSATATAAVSTDPYLEVVMMLDNSSSMAMGATIADMTTLLSNSPCDKSNAFITTNGGTYTQASNNQ
jgi:Flp pilus assembly protein TadG